MAQGFWGEKRCSNEGEIYTWTLTLLRSTPKKVSRIKYFFRILQTEGVTKISTLYKISSSKFIFIFESKSAREKFEVTEIHSRFGDKEIIVSFQKQRSGPLRNGKGLIFCDDVLF